MPKLSDLLEQRARTVRAMRAIADKPEGDGGDLSEAQETRFNELKAELAAIEKKIERQQLLDEADRRAAGDPLTGTGDERFDEALRDFSLRRAIISECPDMAQRIDCARERELSAELSRRAGIISKGIHVPVSVFRRRLDPRMEQRVVTTTSPVAGPGGNIIATDHRGDLYIDLLRANLVTQTLGATVLNDLRGNVDIPRLDASAGFAWVAENGAITPSDPEHGQVQMTPKHAGVITEYSRSLLLQSSPDIEQLLRADFAATLARGVDGAALRGGGANEPDGIMETAGVPSVSMATGISWDSVLQMIATVEGGNALAGSPGWAVNPWVKYAGRKTPKVVNGSPPVGDPGAGFVIDAADMVADYRSATTTLLAGLRGASPPVAGEIIFGNWSDLVIGYWSVLDLLVNPYAGTPYSKGNVQLRGMLTTDIALRHAASFAFSEDVDVDA